MTKTAKKIERHPSETVLADYLSGSLPKEDREALLSHLANCRHCLDALVASHETVTAVQRKDRAAMTEKMPFAKKWNIYLILAIVTFLLSFVIPRYFVQFLVATIILGIKWIVDAKSTKMLIMIYEAWKHGGEKEASRVIKDFENKTTKRF